MEGNDKDPRIHIKGILDAVSVMGIAIDKGDPLAPIDCIDDGNGNVIDVTESLGMVRHSMVKASVRIEGPIRIAGDQMFQCLVGPTSDS